MIFINNINIYLYQYLLGNAIVHIITGIITLYYILSFEENQDTSNINIFYCLMYGSDTSNIDDCWCITITMLLICVFLTLLGIYYWALKRSDKRQRLNSDNRIIKNLELVNIL